MVTGKSVQSVRIYPEKVNRPEAPRSKGESKDQDHMANWIDCVRTRKTPNAPVEIGYRSAMAVHMSNISYRQKQRVTLEEARAFKTQF